jgi:hypothetical protein
MKNSREKRLIQELLEAAGIQIDGTEPFDIHVHNPDFYPEVLVKCWHLSQFIKNHHAVLLEPLIIID